MTLYSDAKNLTDRNNMSGFIPNDIDELDTVRLMKLKKETENLLNDTFDETGISTQAIYEQAAEECAELAHALLKYARIMRQENPTPAKPIETSQNIVEEYSDLCLCMKALGINPNEEIMNYKLKRWINRLMDRS